MRVCVCVCVGWKLNTAPAAAEEKEEEIRTGQKCRAFRFIFILNFFETGVLRRKRRIEKNTGAILPIFSS